MHRRRIGIWLIGALGSISATVILGALALRKGLIDSTGMITATEPFGSLGLSSVENMEFGGCDIRRDLLRNTVRLMVRDSGCIDPSILSKVDQDLESIEKHITAGTVRNCGEAIIKLAVNSNEPALKIRDEIRVVIDSLLKFKESKQLDDVVVVNVASTEPPLERRPCHEDLPAFEECLDRDEPDIVRAGTIYAYAAIQAGCPYINFTPSTGALIPALVTLAEEKRVPLMGSDGKTGETLVKSALAPMFMCRNLEVLSWEGFNILGNMDGRVLDHPENKESKILTKDAVLPGILGYSPHSQVHINYVPSLCDQKTAWDFIHFRGFMGAKMSLQFVWQGYDSILAAPLVLDLVRFADFAKRNGESGLMPHLACYFKNPIGVNEHRLYQQFQSLLEYGMKAGRADV